MQQGGMHRNMLHREFHRLSEHIRLMGNSHPRTAIPQQKANPREKNRVNQQVQKMETRTVKSSQTR